MPRRKDNNLPADWQLSCNEIRQRCARLLSSGAWADCWFAVGAARARVAGHRLVLAMSSPVFEAMCSSAAGNPIAIPDMQLDAFKALLENIYTDNINLKSCNTAYELYFGAQKYKFPHLPAKCVTYLLKQLSPQNACTIYEFAELAKEENLKIKCLETIKRYTREALADKSFESLHIDTVEKIFSIQSLNIDSELDLVKAAERYARAHCLAPATVTAAAEIKKEKLTSFSIIKVEPTESDNRTQDDEFQIEDEKVQMIRKAVKQIRFLSLTQQQFSQHDFSSLLTVGEINAIALNLMSESTHAPMPSGFSTSRMPRNHVNKPNTCLLPTPRTDCSKTQNKHFHTKIFDIKYLLESTTYMFDMHNMHWRLDVNPFALCGKKTNSLSIFVTCLPKNYLCGAWSCNAKLIVRIVSHKTRTKSYSKQCVSQFSHRLNSTGWNNFIQLKELMDPSKGYVLRNAITVHIKREGRRAGARLMA